MSAHFTDSAGDNPAVFGAGAVQGVPGRVHELFTIKVEKMG